MRSYCIGNTTSSYSCKSVPVVVVWWFFLVCYSVLPTVLLTTVEGRSTHPNRVTTPTGLGLLGATHSGHKQNNKNKSKNTHNLFLKPNTSKKKRKQKHALYQWGNMGSSENSYYDLVRREPVFVKVERYLLVWTRRVTAWCHRHVVQLSHYLSQPHNILALSLKVFRYWVFYFFSRDCFQSLYDDRWHCERDPDDFFGSGRYYYSGLSKFVHSYSVYVNCVRNIIYYANTTISTDRFSCFLFLSLFIAHTHTHTHNAYHPACIINAHNVKVVCG